MAIEWNKKTIFANGYTFQISTKDRYYIGGRLVTKAIWHERLAHEKANEAGLPHNHDTSVCQAA